MKARNVRAAASHVSNSTAFLARLPRLSYVNFRSIAFISDTSAVIIASVVSSNVYHWLVYSHVGTIDGFLGVGTILAALTVALIEYNGWYAPDRLVAVRSQVAPVIAIWTSVLLFLLAVSFTLKISEDLSRGSMLSLAITGPIMILGQRYILSRAMLAAIETGWLRRRNIMLITEGKSAAAAAVTKHTTLPTHDIVWTFMLSQNSEAVEPMLAAAIKNLRRSNIDEIHIAVDWSRWSDIKRILASLRAVPLPVRLIADETASEILQYPEERLCGVVSVEIQRAPLTSRERIAKRTFDIIVASLVLLALVPLMAVVSLLVRIESPGPILFRQTRGGSNGRAFALLKFRTMRVMEDGPVIKQASRNDQRVTRVGRWLRRYSIDELPQLINVLRGEMSLVGPRPHALAHDDEYSSLIGDYPFRHHVRPGITGWAQINGFRGETATLDLMKRRIELDLWYVANWSFWLDLCILFWTVPELCRSRNAF